MSEISWNSSDLDRPCDSYRAGHQVHWIQAKISRREPPQAVPVTASVDEDGVVLLEGDDLYVVSWNHRPAHVRAALQRSGGIAQWRPNGHVLAVPTGHSRFGSNSLFSLAAADQTRECSSRHT